jgi:hypothetical protein
MFTTEAYFRASESGLSFKHANGDFESGLDNFCSLRVTFRGLAWYPEERDTGCGADFDAEIASIEMRDWTDQGKDPWYELTGGDRKAAEAHLEKHHHRDMWDQAESDVYEQLGERRWAA